MSFSEFLAHPMVNTGVTLLVGSGVVLIVTQVWQSRSRQSQLLRDYLLRLRDIEAQIRVFRRKTRLDGTGTDTRVVVISLTEIENALRSLTEEGRLLARRVGARGSAIHQRLEQPAAYFRDITQEMEQVAVAEAPNRAQDSWPTFESLIDSRTEEFESRVLSPLEAARRAVYDLL